jgi:hypothetical protein
MKKVNYLEVAQREQLLNTLRDTAQKLREEHPAVASLIYGAMLAVITKKTLELAQQIREFSKAIVFQTESIALTEARNELSALLLQVEKNCDDQVDQL